jgi:hypothetical protein
MKVFTDFSSTSTELRDNETGRLVSDLPPLQRERYLLQHPEHRDRMPPPRAELNNPAFSIERDPPRVGVLARPVWPDRAGLLRDPSPMRPPTKPIRTHTPERRAHACLHEAGHITCSLLVGLRAKDATAVPGDGHDGVVYLQNSGNRLVDYTVSVAGQAADELGGIEFDPRNYVSDAREYMDIPMELRLKLHAKAKELLIEGRDLLLTVYRELLKGGTVSEQRLQELKLDWDRKQQAGTAKNASKVKQPQVRRSYNFSNPADVAALKKRFPDIGEYGVAPGLGIKVQK